MKITKLLVLFSLIITSSFILVGCHSQTVSQGDTITVSYDSFLQDGTNIEKGQEIKFTVGLGQTFPAFDTQVINMKKGETKSFTATAKEGYGIYHDSKKIQNISTTVFNKINEKPVVGQIITLGDMKGLVLEVGPITNKIDFNEPQTLQDVKFKIKVINIEKNK